MQSNICPKCGHMMFEEVGNVFYLKRSQVEYLLELLYKEPDKKIKQELINLLNNH